MKRTIRLVQLLAIASVAWACVTINVYFPEEAVKDLSEKIEDAVAREAAKDEAAAEPAQSGGGMASLSTGWVKEIAAFAVTVVAHVIAPPVYAQEVVEPEISNPAIRRIIQSRGARVDELDRFKASGAIGENKEAEVEVRDLQSLALADRAAVQRLVKAENDDREQMFKEIAAATGADMSTLPQIRETYAETLRKNAKPGEWIQMPDGSWKKK
jgi:uncharacterized protein